MSESITSSWDDDPLMYPAFIACVSWALGEEEIVARSRAETGNNWQVARTPIDRMIDQATGIEREFFQAFASWVEANIFGTSSDGEAT